jgi:hypothetical protein
MDKVETYRAYVQDVLAQFASIPGIPAEVETQTIFDTQRDHYQLVNVGWHHKNRRVYGCVVHIDIKDGKVWIQWDGTDIGIASELVEKGIPKEDIVLAFHAPYARQYTGFAVN